MILAIIDIFLVMNIKPIHESLFALEIAEIDEVWRTRHFKGAYVEVTPKVMSSANGRGRKKRRVIRLHVLDDPMSFEEMRQQNNLLINLHGRIALDLVASTLEPEDGVSWGYSWPQ